MITHCPICNNSMKPYSKCDFQLDGDENPNDLVCPACHFIIRKDAKLKLDVGYDDGLTTYTLIDTRISDDPCYICNELLTIEIHDGNFKRRSENWYHDQVKKFMNKLIEEGRGWND